MEAPEDHRPVGRGPAGTSQGVLCESMLKEETQTGGLGEKMGILSQDSSRNKTIGKEILWAQPL